MRSFGSDNHSGVHPAILEAIAACNADHEIAYGDDTYTARVRDLFKKQFGETAEVFPVFNGTGANVVAQRACVRSFNSILCAETAHIAVDECGAPAFMTGASLVSISTPDGKLTPELIRPHLTNWGFEHHSQPKSVYISQCSELGTVYTCEEIRAIADFIHPFGMYLHLDGARIANAAVTLGKTFKEMTTDCGVDIVSFGGTKNGMLMGESVVVLNPALVPELKYHRKQCARCATSAPSSSPTWRPASGGRTPRTPTRRRRSSVNALPPSSAMSSPNALTPTSCYSDFHAPSPTASQRPPSSITGMRPSTRFGWLLRGIRRMRI